MIILCTDYGSSLYVGQLQASILSSSDRVTVINGIDDLPAFNFKAAAYLLNALIDHYPSDAMFVAVVDPGVGGDRAPIYFQIKNRWFVGPDNGIFSRVLARSAGHEVEITRIDTAAFSNLSRTFHGRDVFAPAAAMLAAGSRPSGTPIDDSTTLVLSQQWPKDLYEIIYVDSFGNCMTGVTADALQCPDQVAVRGSEFSFSETFSSRPRGCGFWYINSLNLVEIAASQASAADVFGIKAGDDIKVMRKQET